MTCAWGEARVTPDHNPAENPVAGQQGVPSIVVGVGDAGWFAQLFDFQQHLTPQPEAVTQPQTVGVDAIR